MTLAHNELTWVVYKWKKCHLVVSELVNLANGIFAWLWRYKYIINSVVTFNRSVVALAALQNNRTNIYVELAAENYRIDHDDVIKWKKFPRYWSSVREFTGHRLISLTKASDAELWCFLWSAPD